MSTLPPECEQLLISGYVLGNLSSAEALLFEEMLSENPALREQVVAMQQVLDRVYMPKEVSPPPALRDLILAAADAQKTNDEPTIVESTPQSLATEDRVTTPSPSQPRIIGVLGAIALAIIAVLGIANYRLWQRVRADRVDSVVDQNTYLLQSDNLPDTVAKLVVNGDRLSANLIVNNLPPLPPEKAYALWTVVGKDVPYTTDEKGAILTAVFQVDESGNFAREIAVPQPHLEPKTINKIAITIEDVATPQTHTGSILLSTPDE
jgi:hypothetical protein